MTTTKSYHVSGTHNIVYGYFRHPGETVEDYERYMYESMPEEAKRMIRTNVYFNRSTFEAQDISRLFGDDAHYRPGDLLEWTATVFLKITGEDQLLEHIWFYLNADDRPNGHVERSLSIGDVVVLHSLNGNIVGAFTPVEMGWDQVKVLDFLENVR